MSVDWERYQKCPVCPATLGEACIALSGTFGGKPVRVDAPQPHSTRKLTAAAARAGGDRG